MNIYLAMNKYIVIKINNILMNKIYIEIEKNCMVLNNYILMIKYLAMNDHIIINKCVVIKIKLLTLLIYFVTSVTFD